LLLIEKCSATNIPISTKKKVLAEKYTRTYF
jgi:hypothetical protein